MLRRHLLRRLRLPISSYSTCKRQPPPCLPSIDPPVPKKVPFAASAHGRTWEDPYHWMSDVSDPDLTAYLLHENSYAEAFMADTEGLQRALLAEMTSRMPQRISTPYDAWGNWLYYQYIPEGKEYPVLCRRARNQNVFAKVLRNWLRGCEEEVLLDWNEIAEQFGYVHIGTCKISPNHRFIAYTLDTSGSEMFILHIKDLKTGHITSNLRMIGVVSLAWSGDSSCLLYTVCNESQRPCRVFCANLGSGSEDDLLYTENDLSRCVDITSTKDGKYITINSNSRSTSEVFVIDAMNIKDGIWPVRKCASGVQYFLEHHYGFFYILTNAPLDEMGSDTNGFHLVRCQADKSLLGNWQAIIKPDQDMFIQDMDIFHGHLMLSVLREGLPFFCSIEMPIVTNDHKARKIDDLKPWFFPLPSSLCSIVPGSNLDFMSSVYRVVISSPVMPDLIVDYDMKWRTFTILHQEEVLGLINNIISGDKTHIKEHFSTVKNLHKWVDLSEEFSCERREVISHDGARVPLTIVYSQRTEHSGESPGVLHGYGAYGEILEKSFCSYNISLLARGWVLAYADVRGGGPDVAWHKAGTRSDKLNSVYDFAACAMFLKNEGYVHESQLGAIGCSAGGLLVGAAINIYPNLFSTAILKVPFIDICNTLLDASLPLTNLDYDEFGDPRIETNFETIRGYSPYDNIHSNTCYPSMLVTASFHDSRVGVWEAAKWVARMREETCQNCARSVILKTNMSGGHFGEGGRYNHCGDVAFEFAFLIKAMGLLHKEKESVVRYDCYSFLFFI
ncbi:oligopeptidase B [Apostasia shenzhenica]|uniref:Prolyl endopeptidase n=1 Tax=Apostasia shenzhenica TaxID=1088818 RepID=A0A2I0ABQ4_9ASPA|nr:oligopeptidase B [Apostasia shenzhenica]